MTYGIIYYWHCEKTNMGYVGQTTGAFLRRWKGHCKAALNERSRSWYWEFPKAIREHGADNFVGHIICECDTAEELSTLEDYWMHELNTLWPNGYNMRDGTNFVCEQTRQLISERTKNGMSKLDPSHKDRQREAMKDPNVRQLISERTKDAMHRPEVKARCEAVAQDPEYRKRISETLMGHVVSEETKQKISINTRKAMALLPKKPKINALCQRCQVMFVVKKKGQHYCSQTCYWGSSK